MIQPTNNQFQELASALLGASHRLLRSPLAGDLEPAAFAVLALVNRSGAARPSDLAATMRLDVSTISRHIQKLETDGYVARGRDARGGRSYRLQVTPTGLSAIKDGGARRAAFFRQAIAHWPRKDFDP